jgi:hypothetical protein
MRTLLALSAALALAATASASFFDDFESYTTTAQMLAPGAWGDEASTDAPATLNTDMSNYMWHPGGKTAKHVIAPLDPANGAIIWEYDLYDDGVGNKRVPSGLRTNAGGAPLNSLLEMGRYNAIGDPESGTTVSGYGIRHAFIGGDPNGAGGWVTFLPAHLNAVAGWHHLTAVIEATQITFTIDLQKDGSVDGTRVITTNDTSGVAIYNILRLGGPSDVSSAGGGVGFDNVSIYQIPEPLSFALLALGLLIRRR